MDTLNGLDAASTNSTQVPIISCFPVFGSKPAGAPSQEKTGPGCVQIRRDRYLLHWDLHPWLSTLETYKRNDGSCTACGPGFLLKDSVVQGSEKHWVGSGWGFRKCLRSALDIRPLKSTAEPQGLGWTWDREGKWVQCCNQSVGGAPIP